MWIELKNIHKHYGSVKANNGITLTVRPGTIHGVLGENGAGKSTLFNASILNTLLHWISSFLLRLFGWRKVGGFGPGIFPTWDIAADMENPGLLCTHRRKTP